MMDKILALKRKAYRSWVNKIDTGDMEQPVVVTNSLSWARDEWLLVDGQWVKVNIPPMGYGCDASSKCQVHDIAENIMWRMTRSGSGLLMMAIESIYDKRI